MTSTQTTFSLVFLSLFACSDATDQYIVQAPIEEDQTDTEDEQETEDNSSDGSNSSGNGNEGLDNNGSEDCTNNLFDVQGERSFIVNADSDQPLFVFQATNSTEYPMDIIEVLSYPGEPYNGPSSPGTYSLEGNNYEDCSLCLIIYADCGESSCDSMYFSDTGTVTFDTNVNVDQNFSGKLNNVVFREVEIDSDTYHSTPVEGGNSWCVDSLHISSVPLAR
jgi:hypothetical protein